MRTVRLILLAVGLFLVIVIPLGGGSGVFWLMGVALVVLNVGAIRPRYQSWVNWRRYRAVRAR